MQDYKRVIFLIATMMGVAVIIGASAVYLIYQGGIDRERLRLQDMVQSQARHAEVAAALNRAYSAYPPGPDAQTILQLVEGYRKFHQQGLGETGEITLGRRDGNNIVFLLRHHHAGIDYPEAVTMDSGLAGPMRAALSGQSGTMIETDHAGNTVLAAYEPVSGLNLGLVAKVDLSEVRQRFTRITASLALISVLTVAVAAGLFFVISEPMIRRLRQSEVRFRELFENMRGGAAVYEAVGAGRDFVFKDLNHRGEQIEQLERQRVIGTRVTDAFPGIREFGLLDVLKEVWETGVARSFPRRFYKDERIQGWRDNYVYKLPSGEIVALFDDISERKRAEDALRESEARFRGTFENAAVGIAHVTFDGIWLRVNQRLCGIVGYGQEELLQKRFQDIVDADDVAADLQQVRLLVRGGIDTFSLENRFFHKAGHVVWVNLTIALERDEAGKPLYCIAIIEDISARNTAEQSSRQSEARMRALLDASQDEILLLSTDGTVRAVNKAAERRLKRRLAGTEPVGAALSQILPAELADVRMAMVQQVAKTTRLAHVDWQIGSRWFEFWFYPVQRSDAPVTEVAVYAREITRRKNAENELRRLYQAIQQSPASVIITDLKGNIVYVNPKFSEVTGYAHDEVIGKNPRLLKSGDTSPDVYQQLWATILNGQVWNGEFRNRKKDGTLFWELASIGPVKDEAGKIISFVGVKEDITERRAVEEQLRQSQKMQAIGQLTGGIAHDFNNLLTIILGNLQLLEQGVADNEKLRGPLADALWAARRGGELTHRLLAFARLQPLRPAVVNLNTIVRGLTDLLRRTLGAAIEIREDLAADLANVWIDAGEFERALVNLAVNARDAMPNGGALGLETRNTVLDEAYAEQHPDVVPGQYAMLAISDTGTGIQPDVLSRIFDPFFTTKTLGRGTGLGLSMVYGFVKQSGGHVNVYSDVGTGTTFRLFFPLAVTADGTAVAPPLEEISFSAEGKVALVVEDEDRLRAMAATILREVGFSVLEAGDGLGAVRQAETARAIDLLFTDMELPGRMNGAEVAERVEKRHPRIKCLYTSGYSPSLGTENNRLPANAVLLAKPYTRHELVRYLRSTFAEKQT